MADKDEMDFNNNMLTADSSAYYNDGMENTTTTHVSQADNLRTSGHFSLMPSISESDSSQTHNPVTPVGPITDETIPLPPSNSTSSLHSPLINEPQESSLSPSESYSEDNPSPTQIQLEQPVTVDATPSSTSSSSPVAEAAQRHCQMLVTQNGEECELRPTHFCNNCKQFLCNFHKQVMRFDAIARECDFMIFSNTYFTSMSVICVEFRLKEEEDFRFRKRDKPHYYTILVDDEREQTTPVTYILDECERHEGMELKYACRKCYKLMCQDCKVLPDSNQDQGIILNYM